MFLRKQGLPARNFGLDLGFPYAVLVGNAWKQEENLEIRTRATGTVEVLMQSDAGKVLSERIANARLGKEIARWEFSPSTD